MTRLRKILYTLGGLSCLFCIALAYLSLRFDSGDRKLALWRSHEHLLGPVRDIEYQHSFIDFDKGIYRESQRFPGRKLSYDERGRILRDEHTMDCLNWLYDLSMTQFDSTGKVIMESYFHHWYDFFPWLTQENVYDSSGRLLVTTGFDSDDKKPLKCTYSYEIDSHGNWIKKTASVWDPKSSKISTKYPQQVTYRTISYYEVLSK